MVCGLSVRISFMIYKGEQTLSVALQSPLNSGLIEFSNTNTCIHGRDGRGLRIYCGVVPPQTYEIEIVVLD